ncbi:hypothetical protein [Bifidobacterium sp. SO4]|uniref:hypothetical protein n=1 Tax=Bifidobacterium sp. SO4 TaxID=2809030 RepID=UPI001BDC9467|nr:hypothetical protein [Bifidobacterium sp. SO4]MBT1171747.1 hypothetical protein [Bifidobacterium sp. SO4]
MPSNTDANKTNSFLVDAFNACLVTLIWVAVACGSWLVLRDSSYRWFVASALVALLMALVATAVCAHGRVREAAIWSLPVAGDVRRASRRAARRRGNQWLRDAKLVPNNGKNYRCWLTKDSLRLENVDVVGITEHRLREAISASLNAWDCADYELEKIGNAVWQVRLLKVSRFDAIRSAVVVHEPPIVRAGRGQLAVRVGRGLDGDAWIDFANVAGVLLAGDPGEGKSASLDLLVSAFLSRPDLAEVHLLNGKGDMGWDWARSRCASYSNSTNMEFASAILELVWKTMERRNSQAEENFWNGFTDHPKDKVIVLVIDEAQMYVSPQSPEDKNDVKLFTNRLISLIKLCRSAGIVCILATQKPTAASISTDLRDVMGQKVCFFVSSPESARAALGVVPEGEPLPTRPTFGPEDRGMAVRTTGTGGTEIIHFDYLPHEELRNLFPAPVKVSTDSEDLDSDDDWVIREDK